MKFLFIVSMFCNLVSRASATSFIALKQRNVHILEEALANVSNPESSQYGNYWTQEEIDAVIVPDRIEDLHLELEWCGMNCEQKSAAFVCDRFNDECLYDANNLIEFIEIMYPHEQVPYSLVGDNTGFVAREVMIKL